MANPYIQRTDQPSKPPALRSAEQWQPDFERYLTMAAPDFDWVEYWEDGDDCLDDVFRKAFQWHNYETGNRPIGSVGCGGCRVDDTPKAFYRACYLFQPSNLDLSDMYKTGSMIDVASPCYEFQASIQLFKYEVQVYFGCDGQHATGKPHGVQGGWADCDNGIKCSSELGNRWFAALQAALNREWEVYSGNNFFV